MAINFPDSPSNGDQYVVAGNTYTWNGVSWDATGSAGSSGSANIENDIDNHLNTSTASTGEVLSWNGSDYDWVSNAGGGGGGGNTLSDGDKGDITVSNSGATWSIDDGVVNAAALAADSVTTDKILNNSVTVGKISATGTPSSSTYLRGDGSWSAVSGGGGSSTFTGLTDTPSSFTADKWLKVNSAGNALEFTDAPSGGGGSSDPVGTIVAWSGASSTIPSEYQLCDGAAAQTTELQAITGANVPDLRDRFIVGASDSTGDTSYPGLSPGGTGGSADATLVSHSHTINNHTHSFSGSGSDTVSISISGTTGNQSQNHTHNFGANTFGAQSGSSAQLMDNPQSNGGGQKIGSTSGISQDHNHSFSASGSGTASISISGTTGNPSNTGTNTQGSSATNANLPPYYSLCYIVKHTATSGSGGGSSTTIISPVAYAVVGTNSAGSGTGMSWGAYDSSTGQVVFTFDTAQPDTDYYVHTNREQFATHNIEVLSKSTTGFTTKWTNSDVSFLPPGTFKGVLIVYASTPTKTVGGGGGGSNSGITTANINADTLNVSGISTFAGITTVTGQTLFSNQLSVSGISTYNGLVHVSGNNKLNLGNLNDLYLQWEENSQSATLQASAIGNLYFSNISNGGIFLNAGSGNQSGVHLYPSDRVELRHAATKRLETTSEGVQVTGTLAADVNVVGTFTFTANGSSNYIYTGTGYPGTWTDNNIMYLHLGLTYKFINATGSAHPLEFTDNTGNYPNNGYNDGWITGSKTGVQYVTIPYVQGGNYIMNYRCTLHPNNMGGQIQIVS